MGERRSHKFMVALSPTERTALQHLADRERISAAAVVRRLVWNAARERGLLPINETRTDSVTEPQGVRT